MSLFLLVAHVQDGGSGAPPDAGPASPVVWGVVIAAIVLLGGSLWWAAHRRPTDPGGPGGNPSSGPGR